MIALVSDLHSNLEALEAVLKDLAPRNAARVYCLGDVVGYGPNPNEVIDHARKFDLTILGNHDEAVTGMPLGFNPLAKEVIEWTREELRPTLLSARVKKDRWNFLERLPTTHRENDILYVHGSPRQPTTEYILKTDVQSLLGEVPPKIRDIFERFPWVCIVGHTHEPGVITQDGRFLTPEDLGYEYHFERNRKYIVNPGSVGQPRDGDVRSSYATLDGDVIRWHRVNYDIDAVVSRIKAHARIDDRLGDRLTRGR